MDSTASHRKSSAREERLWLWCDLAAVPAMANCSGVGDSAPSESCSLSKNVCLWMQGKIRLKPVEKSIC